MVKKRGVHYSFNLLAGILLLTILFLLLLLLPSKYRYSNEIFKQEFVKDNFNVINGSEIKFSNAGIKVEDFLLINEVRYKIDKKKIEDISIRKESTNNGTKIIYGLRNEGEDKEIQFIWQSYIPEIYDRANGFNLSKDFVTDSQVIGLYSNNSYRSHITFRDVGKSFGGVSLSYNANTRTLIASSNKIKLKKNQEIVMDPGISFAPPTPNNRGVIDKDYAEIKISTTEINLEGSIWNWNGINYSFYDDSLVLMLNLNNISALGESNTKAVDVSKYRNNGTIYGATYTQGRYGYGLGFNGIDNYVYVDDSNSLDLDIFSIEFWFKPDENYDSNTDYVSFVYGSDYGMYIKKGNMVFNYKENKINSSTNEWNKDQWYHILATYDGSVQKIYVNSLKEKSIIVYSPFTIKSNAGENIAFFLNSGDIVLKGRCSAGSCSYPGDDAFVIQNPASETVAYIDSNGNLCIKDNNCNGNDANCDAPGEGSFIIKSTNDKIVSYINPNGGLCLIGNLIENGIS